jgi:hypothetical protein
MMQRFWWTAFDVTSLLPRDWPDDIKKVACEADFRSYPRTPFLSREAVDIEYINRGRVRADAVQQDLHWLYELYRGEFLSLAQQAMPLSLFLITLRLWPLRWSGWDWRV